MAGLVPLPNDGIGRERRIPMAAFRPRCPQHWTCSATAHVWILIYFENAFVSRLKRRICIRGVRFCRSTRGVTIVRWLNAIDGLSILGLPRPATSITNLAHLAERPRPHRRLGHFA
jgi:hypothetical protein